MADPKTVQGLLSGEEQLPPYALGGFTPETLGQQLRFLAVQEELAGKTMGDMFQTEFMTNVRMPLVRARTRSEQFGGDVYEERAKAMGRLVDVPVEGIGTLKLTHQDAASFIADMARVKAAGDSQTAGYRNFQSKQADWLSRNPGKSLPKHLRTWSDYEIHLTGIQAGLRAEATTDVKERHYYSGPDLYTDVAKESLKKFPALKPGMEILLEPEQIKARQKEAAKFITEQMDQRIKNFNNKLIFRYFPEAEQSSGWYYPDGRPFSVPVPSEVIIHSRRIYLQGEER